MTVADEFDAGAWIDANGMGWRQWRIAGLCAFVALLDGLDLQSIGLAAPAMGAQLRIAPPAFGVVFSAALAGLAIGAFILGPGADRLGRKTVLIAATLWFGVFTLLTARATGLNELLLYRFCAGAGLGGAMPSFISLASEYVPSFKRATVVSLIWAGFPLGGVLGGLLGSWIIPAFGWPSIFIVGGVIPVIVAALLIWALPESVSFLVHGGAPPARIARALRRVYPSAPAGPATRFVPTRGEKPGKTPVGALFTQGRATGTILLWISFFFAFMVLVANSSWSPILLRIEGLPVQQSAVALAAYNFGSLLGSSAAGYLVTRFGGARVLSATLAAGAFAFACVGWGAPSMAAVTAAESMFGLLLGCASSGLIALAAVFYPGAIRSTGIGWATAAGRIGSATGPLVIGALAGAHWPVPVIFMLVAGSVLIGALACALMGLPRRQGGDAGRLGAGWAP